MTVAQLIHKLKKVDRDSIVGVWDPYCDRKTLTVSVCVLGDGTVLISNDGEIGRKL